jgi:FkbM family methyltransferase
LRTLRHKFGLEPIRTTTYLGHPFAYPADSFIGQQIARGGAWDPILRTVATALLPSDAPTICEVGSNIGASVLQIVAAKPHAEIYAFEPSNRFQPLLARNLAAAGAKPVHIRSILLGRASGQGWLSNNTTSASMVSAEYDGHDPRGRQLAEMATLDDAMAGVRSVEMIKVDTDGYDFEVLRGAEGILRRQRPLLFFELAVRMLEAPEDELRWLRSLGYRRLACFRPSPQTFIGLTSDPVQAIRWAGANGTYCDVLVGAEQSPPAIRLVGLDLTLPEWNPGTVGVGR